MLGVNGIEAWPGRPAPLGPAYDGAGSNFSLFSEVAEGVELCLFDPDGGNGGLLWRRSTPSAGTPISPTSDPGSGMAIGSMAPGRRNVASVATRPSCSSTPMPRLSRGPSTGTRRATPISSVTKAPATTTTAPPTCPRAWCTTRSSTGAMTAPRRRRCTRPSSTRSTSRVSPLVTGASPSRCAAPSPASDIRSPSTT